jgi:hypothetical protein
MGPLLRKAAPLFRQLWRSLVAQRNVERLEPLVFDETRLVCDCRADRHRPVVANDAALVKEEITRAVVREDPAVPLGFIEGLNCSVFQEKRPP